MVDLREIDKLFPLPCIDCNNPNPPSPEVLAQRQKAYTQRRAFRLKHARSLGTHTQAEWLELLRRCGKRCLRCKKVKRLTKDHIIALYQGGSDSIENIQPLCLACNVASSGHQIDYRPKL